jgi:spermidine/putrescine transport system ATP-binding protein
VTAPALSLRNVTKRYGDVPAVDDLTLDVAPGEFFSLLGPSGCGKTTTLRMVGGFEHPDDGSVLLGGEDVTSRPPNKRNVNTVFQSYALFPHLSVFDNVAYGLRRRGFARSEIDARVTEMLGIVSLPGLGHRKPLQLSGGQQQRVALARALVNQPLVLLLDEPLGALDLKLRRQMQGELKRIQNEVGITFVYVTHDQDEAMTMSDRIAVMRDGRIEQIGVPEEIYEIPSTEFVAGFLGAANLFAGRIEQRDAQWAKVALESGVAVRVPSTALNGEVNVKVGVRPEKIRIVDHGDPDGNDNSLEAVLERTAFSGIGHECAFRLPSGERVTVYRQNVGAPLPPSGESVWLSWRPEHTFAVEAHAS